MINRLHHIQGGADRVYFNTGSLLENNGNSVAYFSTSHEKNDKTVYNEYFVDYLKTRNVSFFTKLRSVKKYLFNKSTIKSLENLIKDFRPDIAHVHLFYGTLSVSVLTTLKKLGIPIVLTIHDYRLLCPVNSMLDNRSEICEKCKKGGYYNCILKKCSQGSFFQSSIVTIEAYMRKYVHDPLLLVDHFIFVSKFSLDKHLSNDLRYKNKSSLLYNFATSKIDHEILRGDYFFFFGRLSKEKGILTLLKSVEDTKHQLVIAGDGPLRNEVESYFRKNSNIHYVGFKTNAELHDLIRNCSFIILPSEWYENNPMTIVESFVLGKPVIAANIGGLPELINQDRGFLFESKSDYSLRKAMDMAMNVKDKVYYKLSSNCRDFAMDVFSEKVHFKGLMRIYNSLVSNVKISD